MPLRPGTGFGRVTVPDQAYPLQRFCAPAGNCLDYEYRV